MLQERYLHPSGQIPAYEWNFGDVNPPVHAWSTIFTYRLDKARRGSGDLEWLERAFHKLLLNFTWWVNRKDRSGQQRVRRRVPRARQHRRVRSQLAAADRRLPGTGGRHGLDGALLPEHARDLGGAGAGASPPTPTCASSSSSTTSGSRRRWFMPATTSGCGTRRTGSSTTCSGCRTAAPSG